MHDNQPSSDPAPAPPACLDAAGLRHWYRAGLASLVQHRRIVDELNVFPIPDADTGTNMVITMRAACQAMDAADPHDLPACARAAADAAMRNARGNSGGILARLLRGWSDAWDGDTIDAGRLAEGLRRGAQSAVAGVEDPADGTILTVAAAVADAVDRIQPATLTDTAVTAAHTAASALAATTAQLPPLARAGVVDSGGLGLSLVLAALADTVDGQGGQVVTRMLRAGGRAVPQATTEVPRETGSDEYGYEVQYLLDADAESVDRLRVDLVALGDSLTVVDSPVGEGGTTTWNVHVHVNDVSAAIESGIRAGRVHRLSVTRFADQCNTDVEAVRRALVALTDVPGLIRLLTDEGAVTVAAESPTIVDVQAAISATVAAEVIMLPDGPDRQRAAEAAAGLARADGVRVAVVPTRAAVQILAAAAVRDPDRRFDDDVIAMAEAVGSCRHAEVTVATRAGLTSAGQCRAGDHLGLVDGDVVFIDPNLDVTACNLVDRLCAAGAELITLVPGAALPASSLDLVTAHIAKHWPLVQVEEVTGDQASPLLAIGAE